VSSPNCSSGCTTGPHSTYGECLRGKSLRVAYTGIKGSDRTVQKKWDAELDSYRDAVSQGMQPESTKTRDIRAAVEWSNHHGVAYSDEVAHGVKFDKALERCD
jgi:hypothetical protein